MHFIPQKKKKKMEVKIPITNFCGKLGQVRLIYFMTVLMATRKISVRILYQVLNKKFEFLALIRDETMLWPHLCCKQRLRLV